MGCECMYLCAPTHSTNGLTINQHIRTYVRTYEKIYFTIRTKEETQTDKQTDKHVHVRRGTDGDKTGFR